MAQKVDPKTLIPRQLYAWEEWADGNTWQLERDKDYCVRDESIRAQAYTYAQRHGFTLRSAINDEGVVVRFTRPLRAKKSVLKKVKRRSHERRVEVGKHNQMEKAAGSSPAEG